MELTDLISGLKTYMVIFGYILMMTNFCFSFNAKNNTDRQSSITYGTIGCLWVLPMMIPFLSMIFTPSLKEFEYPNIEIEASVTMIALLLGILILLNHKNNIKNKNNA